MHPVTKFLQTNRIVNKEGKTRWYSIAGSKQWVPSVTSILSAAGKGEYFDKWFLNSLFYNIFTNHNITIFRYHFI